MDRGRRQRGFKFSAGDWTCGNSSCRNVNFARRDRCNLCNAERDERGGSGGGGGGSFREEEWARGRGRGRGGGGGGGGGGRGGGGGGGPNFAPDDWECRECSNVNWAWRDQCFRCEEPKPAQSDRGPRKFPNKEEPYYSDSNGPFEDDYNDFKRQKNFGPRAPFQDDNSECGPMDYHSMRNGSRFDGPPNRRGIGGFRGGRGMMGRGGRGGGRGGSGFSGRDRSRSPIDRY